MPVSWGSSPEPEHKISGHDIEQYAKYFALKDSDFEIRCLSGLWDVTVRSRDTDLEQSVIAYSGLCETLGEALNASYLILRGFTIKPRL
jgi:hypothetical protein